MGLIAVDKEKCKMDGVCAAECPVKIIDFKAKSLPAPTDNAEELCIQCGHCVAVCPHGALTHRIMGPDQCPEIDRGLQPDPASVEQLLKGRRSVRNYKDKALDRDLISRLIDAARYGPTGHNLQQVQWYVVSGREEIMKYSGMVIDWMRFMLEKMPDVVKDLHLDLSIARWERGEDVICRGAPHVIIAHGPSDNPMTKDSCTIALTYLELAAAAHGLGACWAGYFHIAAANWPHMNKELGFPEGNNSFGAMMIGHPTYRYRRIPTRKEPKIIWR